MTGIFIITANALNIEYVVTTKDIVVMAFEGILFGYLMPLGIVIMDTIMDGGYKYIFRNIKECTLLIGILGTFGAVVFAFLAVIFIETIPTTNAKNKISEQYVDAKFNNSDNTFVSNNEKYSYIIEDGEVKISIIRYENIE
jgi:hypothetical protein